MFMLRFFALLIGAAFAFNVAANAATYVVNDAGDRNDANLANPACADAFGLCTLRAAVEQANATPTSTYHVILLQSGQPYDLTLVGAGEDDAVTGDLDVKTNLAVWVLGGASAEVRGQRADRVFDVHPGGYLYLYRVDPTGGSVSDRGGAIRVRDGLLFVRESRVASSNASNGGCISLDDGSKGWVYASTITKCRAGAGGGLWASASQLTVQTRSVVYGNSANAGGGIAAEYSRVGVYDTFVEQNLSNVKSGGGISNYKASGPLEVHRTNFWHNESKQGGAIHHQGGVANVSDSYFIGNRTSPGTFI